MNKYVERLYNGIIKENPTFVLMLGMCPTLAVTSSEINDPVSNLKASKADASSNNVTVTWNKPTQGTVEKYSVSYSSDGGSTWSTAEETSNLSHTFKDLPIGYYTFKVTPYYYFSQSSYKWGQEAISNSVAVGDFNPVTNVTVSVIE